MDEHQNKFKIWYALKLFGSIMKACPTMCVSEGSKTVSTLSAKTACGKQGWLLVSDYCGTGEKIVLDVKGARALSSATLLDHERNNENVDVEFKNGKLTLTKKMPGSAAFLVKFDL